MTGRAGVTARGMDEEMLAGICDERSGTADDWLKNLTDQVRKCDRKEKHQGVSFSMRIRVGKKIKSKAEPHSASVPHARQEGKEKIGKPVVAMVLHII